jgi:hypothetical protein
VTMHKTLTQHVTVTHTNNMIHWCIFWINITTPSLLREPPGTTESMPTKPQRDPAANIPTKGSKLPKRSSSHTLPSSLGALPEHPGRLIAMNSTTPHTALLLISYPPPIPISTSQKEIITTTHKLALAALTSIVSSL